jgi:hypothetical protein
MMDRRPLGTAEAADIGRRFLFLLLEAKEAVDPRGDGHLSNSVGGGTRYLIEETSTIYVPHVYFMQYEENCKSSRKYKDRRSAL